LDAGRSKIDALNEKQKKDEKEHEKYEGDEQVHGVISTPKLLRNNVRTRNAPGRSFTEGAD
jgi:hypothetical protein